MKKMVVGLAIGLSIGFSMNVFAAAAEKVEAVFAKFSLIVNGATPMEIEPLTYKGSTYLPVRQAALLLGYDLIYEADNRTIILNNPKLQASHSATQESDTMSDGTKRIQSGGYELTREETIKTNLGDEIEAFRFGDKIYIATAAYVGLRHRNLDTAFDFERSVLTIEGVDIPVAAQFAIDVEAFFYRGAPYVDLGILESIPKRTPTATQQ